MASTVTAPFARSEKRFKAAILTQGSHQVAKKCTNTICPVLGGERSLRAAEAWQRECRPVGVVPTLKFRRRRTTREARS